nr:uncharacterized protein LOC110359383 isoform X1 [Columba livia]
MLTILIFSLVFAYNNPGIKDPRGYRCQVESASETPGSERSLNVSVQDPWIAATKGKLSRTQKVIPLECFSLRRSVQVNLLYLDKMDGDLMNQTVEKCTLRSLRVATSAGRNAAVGHTCVLLTHHRRKFQRKFVHREKVFLARTSNYVTRAKLPKVKAFAEGSTVLRAHQENQTLEEGISSTNGKDMPNRQKLSIIGKAFIIFVVLAFAIFCSMFVVFGIPCLCLCPVWISSIWSSRRSPSAASGPGREETATLKTPFLKDTEQKPLDNFV